MSTAAVRMWGSDDCERAHEATLAVLFVEKVKEQNPDLLLLSALLTTTMPNQQKTIEALKAAGLRDRVKGMIGGAPTTRAWADEIGADGYAEDAIEAVATAKTILGAR